MGKRSKLLAAVIAGMMLTTAFVGCGSSSSGESNNTASEGDSSETKTLTVWSHLMENEVEAITPIAEEWGKENNVEVKVLYDDSDFQSYTQAAQSGSGPDIVFGMPHNDLGTFYKAGLLAEVPDDLVDKSLYSSETLFDSVTWDGKLCGLPIAQETIALYYNKDKVSEAPASFEELVEDAKTNGFMFDITNFYYVAGFLTSGDGYIFKNNDGTLDQDDIGLNSDAAVSGLDFLKSLIDDGFMTTDVTGDIAKAAFQSGESAYYISGPWDVAAMNEAGVNFGVAALPTLNGANINNIATIQASFVSSKSENQDLAFQLLKYLTENTGETLFTVGNRMPVLQSVLDSDAYNEDPNMAGFAAQAAYATPTPNIPAMNCVWDPAANNIKSVLNGEMTSKEAADNMVEQIKTGIEQQ